MAVESPALEGQRAGAPSSGIAATGFVTLGVFVVAVVATVALAILNVHWFEALDGLVHPQGEIQRALLFSSWLVLISLPFAIRRPDAVGLRLGSLAQHWRAVVMAAAAAAAATAAVLVLVGGTPYDDASPVVEVLIVPVSEELFFRGVLLATLLTVLRRFHPPALATVLAVLIDGFAFGLGHFANALVLPMAFVVQQATFASVLGVICAAVAVRTRSLYGAILVHAAVNAVVVAL
jgi:hypothetical protein